MRSWPSARHEQAQWLGTDKPRAARGRKKEALECHALLLQGRLGLVRSRPRKFAGGAMPTAMKFFGPAGHKMLSISCTCVCTFVLVCVRLCSACMSSCVSSPLQALGSSARSRGAAGLLSCGKGSNFAVRRSPTLTWEVIRVDQTPPKLRAKGTETRQLVPCGLELAMDFHKHQQSAHSLTHSPWTLRAAARLLHDHVCGAVRQCCVRQVLSPVLQPPQGFVQGCLQRQLVGAEAEDAQWPRRCVRCSPSCYPREYWTCRDESFMGGVSSLAHSRVGSATASTIPLRVLDTYRALSR